MNNLTIVVKSRQKGVTGYVNVGRPSRWGNPYKVGIRDEEYDLDASLELYSEWLYEMMRYDKSFRTATLNLKGRSIGCPCAGAQNNGRDQYGLAKCHAAILANMIDTWESSNETD